MTTCTDVLKSIPMNLGETCDKRRVEVGANASEGGAAGASEGGAAGASGCRHRRRSLQEPLRFVLRVAHSRGAPVRPRRGGHRQGVIA